ncbi:heterokaryon incompatibility protein-domain-containing protein [Lasiosphaeria ovina]|uniref:Heterokaryon incompatibility protein-domain-containing protein n=1 Tax=Lasiosphaeria ovina TaxID=92902 RepID=A0AAE0KHL7_9PEZI|nr:heterokaryon incompatibility protein-domain-containing protein [Lasiosphaeria ovina]
MAASAAQHSDMAPARLIRIVDLSQGREGHFLRLMNVSFFEVLPQYVALSYCWGGDQALKCTRSNRMSLEQKIPFADLPLTLRDAVRVCRQAGFDYIWIDALCILQDDTDDQAQEIAKMPFIYGSAAFTIAASRAHSAEEGFLATRSLPPEAKAFTLKYKDPKDRIGAVTLVQLDIPPEPIDARGWTLQERLLSPRTIEYGTWQTRYICQESAYKRDYTDGWRRDADYNHLRKDTLDLKPPLRDDSNEQGSHRSSEKFSTDFLRDWDQVLRTYTSRQLTKSTDRPLAISGIAERFASILNIDDVGSCYVAGLWKPYLHLCLMWHIDRDAIAPRPAEFQGPSWSWTSVNGVVPSSYPSLDRWKPENITLEVLDCAVDLANARAPFGAVRPGSARLKVRGRLAPGAWAGTTSTGLLDRGKKTVAFFGKNDSESGTVVGMAGMFCDTTELDEEPAAARASFGVAGGAAGRNTRNAASVMVLEVQHYTAGASWGCCGLVLRRAECEPSDNPFEGSVFRRVGTFEYATHREGQRTGESQDEWERRIETKFSWFKNIEPREIEIL